MKSKEFNKIYENYSDKCLFIDYLRKYIYFFDFNNYDYDTDELFYYRLNEMKLDNFCKNKIIENSRFILKQKLESKLQQKGDSRAVLTMLKTKRSKI